MSTNKKVSARITSEELMDLITKLEADRSEKIKRLTNTLVKLNRSRILIRNQREIIRRMRARIVELTPALKN